MTTKETATAAVQANPEDVWNVMKTIYLPRGQGNEEQSRFVAGKRTDVSGAEGQGRAGPAAGV